MQIYPDISNPFLAECANLRVSRVREVKSRSIIYHQKPAGVAFVVKRGFVRLVYAGQSGRQSTRMLLGKGAMFGELPFHPKLTVQNEWAISSGMTCVVEIQKSELESHAIKHPQFQTLLLQTLSSQLANLDRRLQWQLLSPVRNRIAQVLYDLMCFSGGRCGHGHLIDIRLTHDEFSELVVAARPVVSEILAELKAERIIDYTRGHICLLSLDRLASLAEADK